MRVSRDEWLRAAHDTDDWLLSLRPGASSAPTPPPGASAALFTPNTTATRATSGVERPHRIVRPAPAPPREAPRYVRRPLAPPRVRVLSFLQQRRNATATVRTLMRRLHFKKADLLAVLHDLERAGLGRLHVQRQRPLFARRYYEALAFTLTARGRDPAVALFW